MSKAPVWSLSMVNNYRRMFKERYGRDTTLNDDEIWGICDSIFDDTDKATEDQARVESMMDMETDHE